jgi:formyltetrahydrofolate-dependent phosphoribosylglycinamide formyltransferase
VLASGNGSNFQALVDACRSGQLAAEVVGLVTDRPDAGAVRRAATVGVPTVVIERRSGEQRADYDTRLADVVATLDADVIVLAGWMRLLSMAFIGRFPDRILNLHPALPGEFPGTNAIDRALEAAQRLGLRRTGVMVHRVLDQGMDDGPVIASTEVPIRADDTIDSLAGRVHAAEHELLVTAVASIIAAP